MTLAFKLCKNVACRNLIDQSTSRITAEQVIFDDIYSIEGDGDTLYVGRAN